MNVASSIILKYKDFNFPSIYCRNIVTVFGSVRNQRQMQEDERKLRALTKMFVQHLSTQVRQDRSCVVKC